MEESEEIVIDTALQIGDYIYESNFVVVSCHYNVLIGTPWHDETEPTTIYNEGTVHVGGHTFSRCSLDSSLVRISNIGVKKFR